MTASSTRLVTAALFLGGALGAILPACSPETAPEAPYTLDDVCERLPVKVCAQRNGCCTKGGAFDEAGCVAFEKSNCQKNVADVEAGKMTFDSESITPCLAAVDPWAKQCFLSSDELFAYRASSAACREIFSGQVGENGACDRNEQCAPPTGADEVTFCEIGGTCALVRYLSEGGACNAEAGELCGRGLYCDAGSCKKVTPVGAACDAQAAANFECGLDAYCDPKSAKCTAAKSGGADCASYLECRSFICDANKCSNPGAVFDALLCTGG